MTRIIKRDGFVFLVEGDRKGFETFYNLGKDIESPIWKDEVDEINESLKKKGYIGV